MLLRSQSIAASYSDSKIRNNSSRVLAKLVNRITYNKNFWKVVKPNSSNKIVGGNRVILRDGGKVIFDTEMVVNIGNTLKFKKINGF